MRTLQNYSAYTEAEHLSWNKLFKQQVVSVQGKACKEFLFGLDFLKPLLQDIPDLNALSKKFKAETGWEIISINGFVNTQEYFKYLYEGYFPVNISLRQTTNFNFDTVPDIFHDCFGHLPFLTNSQYSKYIKQISKEMLSATKIEQQYLTNIYWYTVEAGVCYENNQPRVYGSSQLSSYNEINYVTSGKPKIYLFNIEKIMQMQIDDHTFQQEIFAIPNFEFLSEIINQVNWLMNKSKLMVA
mgnify:CR=1 FL=1